MTGAGASIGGMIRDLGLKKHPEGGYFREIERDEKKIPGNRAGTTRNASTTILFLLPAGEMSRLHRLASDETWIFNMGGPIAIHEINQEGTPVKTVIGPPGPGIDGTIHTVKAGTWFGALPCPGTGYSLVNCRVFPGFDFDDFELAEKGVLDREYPKSRGIIGILG